MYVAMAADNSLSIQHTNTNTNTNTSTNTDTYIFLTSNFLAYKYFKSFHFQMLSRGHICNCTKSNNFTFLAVQNSSIGDLVPCTVVLNGGSGGG